MEKQLEIIRTSLRLAKPLYDKLDAAASAKGLTMHAEILHRLERSFETLDPKEIEQDMLLKVGESIEKSIKKFLQAPDSKAERLDRAVAAKLLNIYLEKMATDPDEVATHAKSNDSGRE